MDAKQLTRLVSMFKNEAKDHLAAMNRNLLALERLSGNEHDEKGQLASLLEEIFRDAHSLKGAARTVGFIQIETLSHHLESVFGLVRDGQLELTTAICDVLYKALDTIELILENSPATEEAVMDIQDVLQSLEQLLEGHQSPVAVESPKPTIAPTPVVPVEEKVENEVEDDSIIPDADETIRVNIRKLESLMAQASELLVFKITTEQRLADLKKIRNSLKQYRKAWRRYADYRPRTTGNGPSNGKEGTTDQEAFYGLLEVGQRVFNEMTTGLSTLEHQLANDTLRLGMVVNNVQDDIRQARMLPFSTIVDGFHRLVRDMSHQLGKNVELEVRGAEIEVDKKILEEVRDPIIHLLRNALDHGIETPDMREKVGKPAQSTLRLHFNQSSSFIMITVEDDGSGIDVEAIKQKVIEAGTIPESELLEMTESELTRLSLMAGISTSQQVTDLSGRGVGLDIVRHRLESLHGQVDIESHAGEGTTFYMSVPLSVGTTHGLLVRIQDEVYALPISSVVKIVIFRAGDIRTVNGRETLTINDVPTSLVRLGDLLDVPAPPMDISEVNQVLRAILLKSGETRIAFLVDELVGEQEMVIKPLGRQLTRVRNVTGATLMGTGDVVIILNATELIRSAQGTTSHTLKSLMEAHHRHNGARTIPSVLVVDDSITTRTLEKNILEAAGYRVITAIDGTEALRYLRNNTCDVVVSDIQMPQMDGVELTRAIKRSNELNYLPVILVTSLESPVDRERGLEAGADAYIVKSGFDQDDLLSTIRQLI